MVGALEIYDGFAHLSCRAVLRQCALPERPDRPDIRFAAAVLAGTAAPIMVGLAAARTTFPITGELQLALSAASACCWAPARSPGPDRAGPSDQFPVRTPGTARAPAVARNLFGAAGGEWPCSRSSRSNPAVEEQCLCPPWVRVVVTDGRRFRDGGDLDNGPREAGFPDGLLRLPPRTPTGSRRFSIRHPR